MDDLVKQIKTIHSRGESIQLISLPGMGSSRLISKLGGFILHPHSLVDLTATNLISLLKDRQNHNLIIIDRFHQLLKPDFSAFFNHLKILRDQHKYQLSYIFVNHTGKPFPAPTAEITGDLYPLICENQIYLTAISKADFAKTLKSDFILDLQFSPSSTQQKSIYTQTGGIRYLVKICFQTLRDHKSLDTLINNTAVIALFTDYQKYLGIPPNQGILNRLNIKSLLLDNYFANLQKNQLSASETRLLTLFETHLDQTVSKSQICEAVYPDVKNKDGISNAAIDQLIYRLRTKVSDKYSLQSLRGLGYRLSII